MRNGPHYLRFVRALTFVSLGLPVPVVAVAHLAGCNGQIEHVATGDNGGPEMLPTGGGGIAPGPSTGTQPAPGVAPCPSGCGIQVAPDASDDGGDASADASADGDIDGGDGGGPSRGTPELPASWLA